MATLYLNSWAGRVEHPVEIIKETSKRYKIRLLEDALLPSGQKRAGSEVYVPKYAVRMARYADEPEAEEERGEPRQAALREEE